jgi:predicted GNAT family acetyltransferase
MGEVFRDVPARQRFELELDGGIVFADYRREGGRLVISWVEADPALRDGPPADRLMRQVAGVARAEGVQITAECGWANGWLKRHDPDLLT